MSRCAEGLPGIKPQNRELFPRSLHHSLTSLPSYSNALWPPLANLFKNVNIH